MLFWNKVELSCHSHTQSHTYLFESWLGSEESSISTISFDSLGDPFFLERNSVFLVPSGMNLIPRYALLHLASLGFRNGLRSVSNSSLQGPKKTEFPPRKNGSPSLSRLIVEKGLLFTTLLHFVPVCYTSSRVLPRFYTAHYYVFIPRDKNRLFLSLGIKTQFLYLGIKT